MLAFLPIGNYGVSCSNGQPYPGRMDYPNGIGDNKSTFFTLFSSLPYLMGGFIFTF